MDTNAHERNLSEQPSRAPGSSSRYSEFVFDAVASSENLISVHSCPFVVKLETYA